MDPVLSQGVVQRFFIKLGKLPGAREIPYINEVTDVKRVEHIYEIMQAVSGMAYSINSRMDC